LLQHSYEFVKEQIEKEGYNLLSTEYNSANTKLKLKCHKGHEYDVTFAHFNYGGRCSKCFHLKNSIRRKLSYEFVKEQIEKEGYKLLSTEYINSYNKLKTICTKNHIYDVAWDNFKQGKRCPKCGVSYVYKHSYEFVKEQIEKEGYKLLSTEYSNAKKYLLIQCNKSHEYEVKYDNFQQGNRCPICFGGESRAEKEIVEYIKSLGFPVIENNRIIITPLELDIVIPDKKLAIEYCGLYWHSDSYVDKNYHAHKLEACNKAGYRLITIFEDEWINKKDIVKSRLKYILGLETEKIYARKCEIREINKIQAKDFINKYHIQEYKNSSICLGAFYKNELVAVMTFSYSSIRGSKKDTKYDYELNRFCISKNIVGIAGKLLTHFQKNYKHYKIVTFADLRWSEGNLYEKIGMEKCYNVMPNYFYYKQQELKRYHRFNFRKNVLEKKLEIFDSNKTEYQNMIENGWNRIWDCGNIKYQLKK